MTDVQGNEGSSRPYPQSVLQSITPRNPIPDEVRIPLTPILTHQGDEFLKSILEWPITSLYCINLLPKDVVLMFDRYDQLIIEKVSNLKKQTKDAEDGIVLALKAGIQILDQLKSVKYVILFKSADLLIDIFNNTTRFSTVVLCMDLLIHYLQAFRKKELVHEYLKDKVFPLITFVYLCCLHMNSLSTECKFDTESLLPNQQNNKILAQLIAKPEITIDLNRGYGQTFENLEEFELADSKHEKTFFVQDLLKKPVAQINVTLKQFLDKKVNMQPAEHSPLMFALRLKLLMLYELSATKSGVNLAILSLKSVTVIHMLSEDKSYTQYLESNKKMFSPVIFDLPWENLEQLMISREFPLDLYVVLLQAKWSTIYYEPFDTEQVTCMNKLLQRIMANIQRSLQKEKNLSEAAKSIQIRGSRKKSIEDIESMLVMESTESCPKTLFASPDEKFIGPIVEFIKEVFIFEDRSIDNGIQSDFSQVFDLISGYLQFLVDDQLDYFTFSPKLVRLIFEMLKLDMGASASIVKKLLDLLMKLITRPLYKYKAVDGDIIELGEDKLIEYLVELIDLVDSLFVEPTKNYYISHISQFAREAAEHQIWNELPKLRPSMRKIYNPLVVFLDDIMTEMPENIVNPTIKNVTENGLTQLLIDNFLASDTMDFEFIGFFIQFLGKLINNPYKPENFEENILKKCLEKAFRCINSRKCIRHNIKRFSGADSTNSLVVLAEEIIDLVNVKHSTTELIVKYMDGCLQNLDEFFKELWKVMPSIVRGQELTKKEAPVLFAAGWTFKEDLKDNFLMLEKFAQNLTKFYAKFYDIHRTNLHLEFAKIQSLQKFIALLSIQPYFETVITKQRRFLSSCVSRMITQQGNESQKECAINTCYATLNYLCDEYLAIANNRSTDQLRMMGHFLFRQNDTIASHQLFAEAMMPDDDIRAVLRLVNNYHAIAVIAECLKTVTNMNKATFEFDEDKKLRDLFPKVIAVEKTVIEVKVNWFLTRVNHWSEVIAIGKKEVTFDNFSDYTFGAMEMFTNETSPKSFDKIFKSINSYNVANKLPLIRAYVVECSKILTQSNIGEEHTFENAFRYSKVIQTFAYMLHSFDGITILITLREAGVLEFCVRAINFGLAFIAKHRDDLVKVKSIKETKSEEKPGKKAENSVKVGKDLNNLKYVLETLCPKLAICWKLIGDYFNLQRPENLDQSESDESQKEKFNAARLDALRCLSQIVSKMPPEIVEILDKSHIFDEANKPKETGDGNYLTVVLKNVSTGYDTLRHIHSLLQASISGAVELLPKFMMIVSKAEKLTSIFTFDSNLPEKAIQTENQIIEEGAAMNVEVEASVLKKPKENVEAKKDDAEQGTHGDQDFDFKIEEKGCLEQIPEKMANKDFVEEGKKRLSEIVKCILSSKLAMYDHQAISFSTIILSIESKLQGSSKKAAHSIATQIMGKIAEVRAGMFFKPEAKDKDHKGSPTQGTQRDTTAKYRISRNFIKDFKAGNFNMFRQMRVQTSLLNQALEMGDDETFSHTIIKDLTFMLSFTVDAFANMHKLPEIRKLSMNEESFRRRYDKVAELLSYLLTTCLSLGESAQFVIKEDQKEEMADKNLPGVTSAKKHPIKKLLKSKDKDRLIIDALKKELIVATSEYLGNYPTFIKQKINLINPAIVASLSNLFYRFMREKPELKEVAKQTELLKKLCRCGNLNTDSEQSMDVLAMRGLVALIDELTRSDRLIEESIKLEIRHYFSVKNQAKDQSKKDGKNKVEDKDNLAERYVKLGQFENDFKKISSCYLDFFVKSTKDNCEIHTKGENQFITLKEDDRKEKDYSPEQESTFTVLVLMKEIIRSSSNILVDRVTLGQDKTPCKQLVSLSYLIECLANLCLRYPLVLKFVISYNLSKIIRKLKNPWIKDRFNKDQREGLPINFIQFFVRVTLFVDFKNYKYFLTECCKDSYVKVTERTMKSSYVSTVNAAVRRIYFKEVLNELQSLKDEIRMLKSQPEYGNESNNELGIPNRYFLLRLASVYCFGAQELASMIHHLKYINPHGEINLYLCQKIISESLEVFNQENIEIHEDIFEVLSKSLFFLMKINFLCHANKQRIMDHTEYFNLTHPGNARNMHVVYLNDFDSFRSRWPHKEAKAFKKSLLLLYTQNIELDKFRESREANQQGDDMMMEGELPIEDSFDSDIDRDMAEEFDEDAHSDANDTEEEMMFEQAVHDMEANLSMDGESGDEEDMDDEDDDGSSHGITDEFFDMDDEDMMDEGMDEEGYSEGEEEYDNEDLGILNQEISPEDLIDLFNDLNIREGGFHDQIDDIGMEEGHMDEEDMEGGEEDDGDGLQEEDIAVDELPFEVPLNEDDEEDEDREGSQFESESSESHTGHTGDNAGSEDASGETLVRNNILKKKENIKDALAEISKMYPYFSREDIGGLLSITFIDWQMNEFTNTYESLLEEWENNHSKPKFTYKDNVAFFQKLREINRKESLVMKNLYPNTIINKPANRFSLNRAQDFNDFRMPGNPLRFFFEGSPIARIREGPSETRFIFTDRGSQAQSIFDLVRRQLLEQHNRGDASPLIRRSPARRSVPNSGGNTSDEEAHSQIESNHGERHVNRQRNNSTVSNLLLEQMTVIQHQSATTNQIHFEDNDPLGVNKFMELRSGFDFTEIGMRANFLEKNGIDPMFFDVLVEEQKLDIISAYLTPEEEDIMRKKNAAKKQRNMSKPATSSVNDFATPHKPEQAQNSGTEMMDENRVGPAPEATRVLDSGEGPVTTGSKVEDDGGQNYEDVLNQILLNNELRQQNSALVPESVINELDQQPEDHNSRPPSPGLQHGIAENEPPGPINNLVNRDEAQLNQENVDFINSLTPDIRIEILMTCPDQFLQGLTQEMQHEARRLRIPGIGMLNLGPEFIFPEQSDSEDMIIPAGNRIEEEDKSSSKSVDKQFNQLDTSVFLKINKVKEPFLESLMSSLYSSHAARVVNYNLVSVIMANYHNQARIYDTMLFILEQPAMDKIAKKSVRFPPRVISLYPSVLTNYPEIYKLLSHRILKVMNELVSDFHTFFLYQAIPDEEKAEGDQNQAKKNKKSPALSEIARIRHQNGISKNENAFCRLIELLQIEKLATDHSAISMILGVIQQVLTTTKKKKKDFDVNFKLSQKHISLLCGALTRDSLEDSSLTSLGSIISLLCTDQANLTGFIDEMKKTLQSLIEPISREDSKILAMLQAGKQQKLMESPEFMDTLAYHLTNSRKEMRLFKVFKTIEQLFEKYFEVYQKKKKEDDQDAEKMDEESKFSDILIDEETKKQIRSKFSHLLEDQQLFKFWLDLIEILKTISDEGIEFIKQLHPHTEFILPLIECFFISFKILKDDDHISSLHNKKAARHQKLKRKKSVTIANLTDEMIDEEVGKEEGKFNLAAYRKSKELGINDLFLIMCEVNKPFLNHIIEKDIKLLSTSLSGILKKMPQAITFENKRAYFKKAIKKTQKKEFPMQITIRRSEIFLDSFNQIMNKASGMLKGKLQIEFTGEEGNDAGGLTREWFLSLSKEIFNPNYALFQTSATGETFQPNPHSAVNPDHIRYFKFIGIVVGKVN